MYKAIIIILSFLLVSCGNPNRTEPVKLKGFLDIFLAANKDCFNNDLTRAEAANKLAVSFLNESFKDSLALISVLPVEFKAMVPFKENDYIVVFCYNEIPGHNPISNEYKVGFQIISIISKELAKTLKESSLYKISGSMIGYATNELLNLEGTTEIDAPAIIMKEGKPEIYLGAIMVQCLNFNPVNNETTSL